MKDTASQTNRMILPLFEQIGDQKVLENIANDLRQVVYKPWLMMATNHYTVKKIQRKREQKWN